MSDLIRRTDVIDFLEQQRQSILIGSAGYTDANEIADTIEVLKTILSSQLTIKSVQQWIPCSERLPNVSRCIVDIGYLMDDGKLEHEIKIVDFKQWQSGFSFEDDWCNDITKNVIAWMPLPEPYQGE